MEDIVVPVWRTQSATQAMELQERGCRGGKLKGESVWVEEKLWSMGKWVGIYAKESRLGPADTGKSQQFLLIITVIISEDDLAVEGRIV